MTQTTDAADADVLDAVPVGPGIGHTIGLVAAWAIAAIAAVALVWFIWFQVIDPGGGTVVERYVDGGGTTYTSRRGGFTVRLPTTPKVRTEATLAGKATIVESRPGADYTFTVTWRPESSDALADPTTTLNTAAGQLVSGARGSIVEQGRVISYTSAAVKDVTYRRGQTWFHTRLVLSLDRAYVVQVVSRTEDSKPFERLVDTFRLLAAR